MAKSYVEIQLLNGQMNSPGKLYLYKCHGYSYAPCRYWPQLAPIDLKVTFSEIPNAWRSHFTG